MEAVVTVSCALAGSGSLAKCWALTPTELHTGWGIPENSLGAQHMLDSCLTMQGHQAEAGSPQLVIAERQCILIYSACEALGLHHNVQL